MTAERWRFALEILRADGTSVGQVPVTIDQDPLREWLRFSALRRGLAPSRALTLDCAVDPVWDSQRGAPYLSGLHATAGDDTTVADDFGTAVFQRPAKTVAAALVQQGLLKEGDTFHALAMAFAHEEELVPASRFRTQAAAPVLPIVDADLAVRLAAAPDSLGTVHQRGDDVPAFIPLDVLAEAAALTSVDPTRETGGLLIGHLCRDRDSSALFVEVTAQLPARHVEADSTKLTFTSETWTEFRSALELRRHGEIMVGWWHSHPVREWCKSCAEEKRAQCSLRGDFLSEDDRLLHRAIFPRAYSLALVVNDVGDPPTFSVFGWRRGAIELRAIHVTGCDGALAVAASTPLSDHHA